MRRQTERSLETAGLSRLGCSTGDPQAPARPGRVPHPLAACTSSSPDMVATDRPIAAPSGSTGTDVVVPQATAAARGGGEGPGGSRRARDPRVEAPEGRRRHLRARHAEPARLARSRCSSRAPSDGVAAPGTEVLLPLRPNGPPGGCARHDVALSQIDQRIEVDLSERLLELLRPRRAGAALPASASEPTATPTGTGAFYVWVKVHYASPYQAVRDRGARPVGLLAGAVRMAGRRPDGDPRDIEPDRPRQRRVARVRPGPATTT